ncbi:extracellular solute-binding protein [Clostridium cibarium]|uniref:Extracellular solute-binding protein n=1 Tax=Clostridium cibarium TaxID=2762247 RepID=A0ABR8PSB6_9CLOT|nr:extracellular solute-binding protein [Clostridium cibarium]MBD7910989.1 extracellular solute-binding protein [Clostridium cibarium]
MDKIEVYLLNSTLERLPEKWKVNEFMHFNYSDVMKSLYLDDFPNAWKQKDLRKKMATIGANDYFNKWTGKEFMNIDDTVLKSIYNNVRVELADGSIINGKRTGIPLAGGNHQLLFYNKNYVTEEPKTFNGLIEMSQKVKSKYNLDYGFVFPTGACYFILPILYGFGADLWSTDAKDPIPFDSLCKTIEYLKKLIYDKKILPIKWEQEQSMPCFMNGKAAFCIGGDWNIREFDEALEHKLGVCEIPCLERECRTTANASYLFLSKELEPELYKKVETFCTKVLSYEIQTMIIKELYRMPASKNFDFNEGEFDELTVKSYEIYKKSFIMPPLKEVTNMYHVLADLLEPNVLISDTTENLAQSVLKQLEDVDSYYKIVK